MPAPRSEADAVAARLAEAAERLKAQHVPAAAESPERALTADEAIVQLHTLCAELRDADLELRRARARIAALAEANRDDAAPPEAA
jgi:hypothetical protein